MIETMKCNVVAWFQHIHLLGGLLSLMVVICSSTANAYQLYSFKWPQPSTTFYVDIPGADGLWNEAFESAMYSWGVDTSFSFILREVFEDPCDATEGRNGVAFGATNCGDAWGETTLAITQSWYNVSTSSTTQTDIVFNSNESWNVYSTPWHYGVCDFKRVAVHELGHALGLDHEDSGIATIMRTYIGDIIIPQQDDINGVGALYGFPITDGSIVPIIMLLLGE
jgi:predicted Zn-dependent protease